MKKAKITKNIDNQYTPTMFTDGQYLYNIGGWLKDNAIPLTQTIAGGAMVATGIAAPMGIGMMAGGVGQMVSNSIPTDNSNQQLPSIKQLPQQTLNQNTPTFELGGSIGNFVNTGGTHEQNPNNGVPVGNNALLEEGEFIFTNPDTKQRYVFSNRLPYSKSNSYAERAKYIEGKYKRYKNDKIERDDLIRELNFLQQEQEQVRNEMQLNQDNMQTEYKHGGTIHIKPENRGKFNATKERTGKTTEELTHSKNPLTRKRAIFAQNAAKWHHAFGGNLYDGGGLLGNSTLDLGTPNLQTPNFNKGYLYGANNYNDLTIGYPGSQLNPYNSIPSLQPKVNPIGSNQPLNIQQPVNNTQTSNTQSTPQMYSALTPDYWKSAEALIPLGVGLGANALMGLTAKELPINYQRVSPNLVNLAREREIAQRMGDTSRNIASNQLRNVSNNSAEYMANLGAINPMINSVTGSQLAQSYQNQENTNAQIRNQTDAQNAQTQMRELEARAMEKDAVRQQKLAALQGAMSSLSNYTNNVAQDRVQNQILSSLTTDSGYGLMKDSSGNMVRTFTGQGSNWQEKLPDGTIKQHKWVLVNPNNPDLGMREEVSIVQQPTESLFKQRIRNLLNRNNNR